MCKRAERRDSYSAWPLHIKNMLASHGSVVACYSHGNNLANCLFSKDLLGNNDGHENKKKTR